MIKISTALLAREIRADVLVITTGVEKVCIHFGKPNQQALDTVSVAQMTRYKDEGHFPAGSMLPKIVASLEFLRHGGKRVIITSPDCLPAALRGKPVPILLMKEDKMSENKSRREFISQSGKMVTACALFGATGSVAYAADSAKPTCETGKPMNITAKHYYLDNVLLEAGFNVDGGVATSTRTELKTLEIKDGKLSPCAITKVTRTPPCRTMTQAAS